MNSIPYNFIIEAKNLTSELITEELRKVTMTTVESLFLDYNKNKYSSFFLSFISRVLEAIIRGLNKAILVIDYKFKISDYRKKNFYINKQKVPREKCTLLGDLVYEKTYYTNKEKTDGFFFIDELFGFEKYKNYDEIIRALLIDEAVRTNANNASNNLLVSSLNILEYLDGKNINRKPRQTIYYWINNWKLPKITYETFDHGENLYVMVDEKYIHEQIRKSKLTDDEKEKKHYIMSKCFVTFTGAKTSHKRTKLINKHTFITSTSNPWKELMEEIYKIYDFQKIKVIYLLSDAGSWILANKSELKLYCHNEIIVCTCEFHVKQKINRITRDEELRNKFVYTIYEEKNKENFITMVDEIIKEKPNRKDKLEEYKNYIIRHWQTILNMKDSPIKSSMESHISHCIASHFGSRPKGYSKNNIQQYLKLQEANLNDINIMDLYLKSLYNPEHVYNEKEIDFSMFDKSTSLLPVCTSNNPISILLRNIAYN